MGRRGAYLDDAGARAGCDDGGCGADVECVVSVAACADDVDDKVLVGVLDHHLVRPGEKEVDSCCEDLWALFEAVDVRGGEEGADLGVGDAVGDDEEFESAGEVVWGELRRGLDELFEDRSKLGHGG